MFKKLLISILLLYFCESKPILDDGEGIYLSNMIVFKLRF
jgi:hypothetical protein